MANLKTKSVLATITKIDPVKKIVYGILAEEVPDKTKEVFDYATSKPYFEEWNQKFSTVTNGKSVGNCRLMHTTTVAGKFIEMNYDDDAKTISVAAKITDDSIWGLIDEGVLTGFSIGAWEVKSWKKDNYKYWTAKPFEGSVVDNPCMYGATFTELKAAGDVQHKFSLPDNAEALSNKVLSSHTLGTVKKGMYTVAEFATVIAYLNSVRLSINYEERNEEDESSNVGSQLASKIDELVKILTQYLTEEAGEMTEDAMETQYLSASEGIGTSLKAIIEKLSPKTTIEEGSEMTPDQLKTITDGQSLNLKATEAVAAAQVVIATELETMKAAHAGTDTVVAQLATTVATLMGAPVSKASAAVTKQNDTGLPPTIATTAIKASTPELENAGKQSALDRIKQVHKVGGISVQPGSSDYLALS